MASIVTVAAQRASDFLQVTSGAALLYIETAAKTFRRITVSDFITQAKIYTKTNILGTVSQLAGVPTGAVVERGSNSNGEYVKFADGTMICTFIDAGLICSTAEGSIFSSPANGTWTFPVAFVNTSIIVSAQTTSVNRWVAVGNPSTTSVGYQHKQATTSAATLLTRLSAIGRWF